MNQDNNKVPAEPGEEKADHIRLISVVAATQLLSQFNENNVELSLGTLSSRLGYAKSTVHRVASTLIQEGFLEQDPETEMYRLGLKMFSLGALVRRRLSVSAVSKELLMELRDELGENVELAVLHDVQVTYLWDFESPEAVRINPRLGSSLPAIDCMIGRVIVAYQTDRVADRFIDATERDLTPERIQQIRAEIAQIRAKGYGVETDNFELGAISLAAPIFDARGRVLAAIGISVPYQRVYDNTVQILAPRITELAHIISRRMGYDINSRRQPPYAVEDPRGIRP